MSSIAETVDNASNRSHSMMKVNPAISAAGCSVERSWANPAIEFAAESGRKLDRSSGRLHCTATNIFDVRPGNSL